MNPRIQLISILGSLAIMLFVFQLIRRRKLREEYALLWFGAGLVMIAFSIWRPGIDVVADLVGIDYGPSILYLGAIIFGFLIALHFSLALSRLADQNKKLAQELALLKASLAEEGGSRKSEVGSRK
jgi:hypothetical protein